MRSLVIRVRSVPMRNGNLSHCVLVKRIARCVRSVPMRNGN
ncbi:protein of unknown function [Kyrpidia spormannii]|uniref:Uncharacterized protein n=1 Tax=Kyrpidia spormannii TaxID=2055160 RepID=A0A6F9EF61_9BACL|nr:protein of unknown function [Kyrpidia spormannii]